LCPVCNTSNTKPRTDLRQAKTAKAWLLGKQTQAEFTGKERKPRSARTFRRKIAWCWDTASLAQVALTGEVHHAVLIDGIRIGGSVCLIARTTKYVIAWHWVPYDSNEYWTELLSLIPAPTYVVCDGQKGMLKAVWPDTIVQRCRFHAWLNVKAKLTLHPETEAGQQLLGLTRDLLHVHAKRQASAAGATPVPGSEVPTGSCTQYKMNYCVPVTNQTPASAEQPTMSKVVLTANSALSSSYTEACPTSTK